MPHALYSFLKQHWKHCIWGAASLFLMVGAHGCGVMFQHTVYCSEIRGTLLKDGLPLAGVDIKRTIYSDGFAGGQFQDRATTDAQGQYAFPEVAEYRLFRPSLLSANPMASTVVETEYRNVRHSIWLESNHHFKRGGETGLPIVSMTSDVSDFTLMGKTRALNTRILGLEPK